jgi:cyclopropane-fatty-acyl-phospholipid synthase
VAIQATTMGHGRMLGTRNSYGWLQKYIFAGGLIPSLQAIDDVSRQHTTLRVSQRRELGLHYAETLHRWRTRCEAVRLALPGRQPASPGAHLRHTLTRT